MTGNDNRFVATSGASVTQVIVNFANPWPTAPDCVATASSAVALGITANASQIVINASSALSSGAINVSCAD